MKTYRVDLTKTYTTFIVASSDREAEEMVKKMSENKIQDIATYVSDFEVENIQPVTLLKGV